MPEKSHVAMTRCFYCMEGDKILLAKTYRRTKDGMEPRHDLEPLHNKVIDMEPCPKCEGWMEQGIILIGIDSAKSDPDWHSPPHINKEREGWMPNPWRSGGFAVVTEEAFNRIFCGTDILEFALKQRFMFIEHEVMVATGMLQGTEEPDGEETGEKEEEHRGDHEGGEAGEDPVPTA
jgi:hypothetical protein